jgi:hypothetical protein
MRQLIDIPLNILNSYGFKDAYLGNYQKTKDDWGKSIYLAFDINQMSGHNRETLLKREDFISITLDNDLLLFEFEIKEGDYLYVVLPFLEGKYSKISREYVERNFAKILPRNLTPINKISNNWKVLTKHPDLKKYWEERIGVTFTEDMEVWSRPEKQDEIYGYPKSSIKDAPLVSSDTDAA